MSKGTVIQTKRIEASDGNGILTVIQLKGCPLKCTFCGKPESIKKAPEFMLEPSRCDLCGHCISVCLTNALYLEDERIIFNPQSCRMCDSCQDTCPNLAIGIVGERIKEEDLSAKILADVGNYQRVGVLLEGGEPFMQASFTYNLLGRLKNGGVSTSVVTSGYAPWEYLENTAPYVDYFVYNLKHMDNESHTKVTGVSNSLILENFVKLTKIHSNVVVQFKVVPGFNDSEENVRATFRFMADNGVTKVRLSPFNAEDVSSFFQWQTGKKRNRFASLEEDRLREIERIAAEYGLTSTSIY